MCHSKRSSFKATKLRTAAHLLRSSPGKQIHPSSCDSPVYVFVISFTCVVAQASVSSSFRQQRLKQWFVYIFTTCLHTASLSIQRIQSHTHHCCHLCLRASVCESNGVAELITALQPLYPRLLLLNRQQLAMAKVGCRNAFAQKAVGVKTNKTPSDRSHSPILSWIRCTQALTRLS